MPSITVPSFQVRFGTLMLMRELALAGRGQGEVVFATVREEVAFDHHLDVFRYSSGTVRTGARQSLKFTTWAGNHSVVASG